VEPQSTAQRQYEALRAFFVEDLVNDNHSFPPATIIPFQ